MPKNTHHKSNTWTDLCYFFLMRFYLKQLSLRENRWRGFVSFAPFVVCDSFFCVVTIKYHYNLTVYELFVLYLLRGQLITGLSLQSYMRPTRIKYRYAFTATAYSEYKALFRDGKCIRILITWKGYFFPTPIW